MEEKLMFAVIGMFRDFRDFKEGEIQAWVSVNWLTKAPIEVEKVSRNAFIFFCYNGEDRDKLAALSTACYKGALIVFKKWIPSSSLMDYDFSWGTIWIKVEGLPLHVNQVHVASNLLERFGSVIYFDGKAKTDGPQKVIRARVRIQLKGALIPGCYLELEQGRTKWVSFRYEGVFVFCMNCGRIGHKDGYCKKSPRKAKEDILKVMSKLCTEDNDCIINENSILPVYSRRIRGLKGTPGNKTTTINLLLSTQVFKPEDMSESSDTEDDDKDDEEGPEEDHDSDPDLPDDKGDDQGNGPGPSKKRPTSSSGSNSSDSSSDLGRPSRRRKLELHEKLLKKEVDSLSSSRKRKTLKEEEIFQGKKRSRGSSESQPPYATSRNGPTAPEPVPY
ncbi:hypothetical protein RDABS01_004986 [Bienertia sinuspersici]